MLISSKDLTISHLGRALVDKLTLSVSAGELVALIGANGCGKSTFLDSLFARYRSDEGYFTRNDFRLTGSVNIASGTSLALLPQNLTASNRPNSPDGTDHKAARRERWLRRRFGLEASLTEAASLSDGQLQKLGLVRILAAEADLYLLDEPGNYLDLDALTAMEEVVIEQKNHGRGFLMVTHDRALTDSLADRTVYITPNGVYHTQGGYTEAWSLQSSDFASRRKRAGQIRRKIAQLQQDIQRKSSWAQSKERAKIGAGSEKPAIAKKAKRMARRAQIAGRRAEQAKQKLEATKPFVPKTLDLRFPDYRIKNREVFALKDVSFSYSVDGGRPSGHHDLLQSVSLSAATSDKLCLMGANGVGKTTLLRLVLQKLKPSSGCCYLNSGVKLHLLPQGLRGFFREDFLLENFRDCDCHETEVRRFLGAALLAGDKVTESISRFSQGELMRAAVVRCLLERAEFLLLDEPTSHLDIESVEVLEKLLEGFHGGFLLVSHDRALVENVADRLYLLEAGRLRLV